MKLLCFRVGEEERRLALSASSRQATGLQDGFGTRPTPGKSGVEPLPATRRQPPLKPKSPLTVLTAPRWAQKSFLVKENQSVGGTGKLVACATATMIPAAWVFCHRFQAGGEDVSGAGQGDPGRTQKL